MIEFAILFWFCWRVGLRTCTILNGQRCGGITEDWLQLPSVLGDSRATSPPLTTVGILPCTGSLVLGVVVKVSCHSMATQTSTRLFPRVVGVVDLVRLDAEHDAGRLHRQLHAVRRLSEAFNLHLRKAYTFSWLRQILAACHSFLYVTSYVQQPILIVQVRLQIIRAHLVSQHSPLYTTSPRVREI